MKQTVYDTIKHHIQRDFVLEKPKDLSFGHYATPVAFSLAKELRRSPMQIAEEFAQKLSEEPIFEAVTPIKGYINFTLSLDFLDAQATTALENEKHFASSLKEENILLEYVSANPTGPLHIGHARGAIAGDALYRIGKRLGYNIQTEYYINDAGNQIYLLGLSLYLSGRDNILKMDDVQWPEEYYRGEYINDLALEAHSEFGDTIFEDETNIEKLSIWGKEKMMQLIKQNLLAVGIEFDGFVSEKELYPRWDQSFAKLLKNGGIYNKDNKEWLTSSEHGDEKDRVVVREDGRPTYLAGDIIYHDDKFSRGFDKYINIWGADHHGYIARVKAAIKLLGYDESKLEVLLSQMVSLLKGGQPYKMSKRAGNFVLMSEVVEEIGADALRLIFLSKKADTHLEFDIDDLKVEDSSNPIFYLNYAHARVNSLFEKANKSPKEITKIDFKDLSSGASQLLFDSLILHEVLEDAFAGRSAIKVTEYLKNLAASIHKFYNENRIIGTEHEDIYLKLLATAAMSLRVGLLTLGIEAKQKM